MLSLFMNNTYSKQITMQINSKKLNQIGEILSNGGYKLALAESMPAGYFSSIWSLQTESGDYFEGSIVCYSENVKVQVLKVSKLLIDQFSAESIEVTEAMLNGLTHLIKADVYISITGKAFADSNKICKNEVGEVFISACFKGQIKSYKYKYKANHAAEVFIQAFNSSLDILESELKNN